MTDTFAVLVNLSPFHLLEEGLAWIEALKGRAEHDGLAYYLALPYDVLNAVSESPAPAFVVFGGQFMSPVTPGCFTEAIAGSLLKQFGTKFVLLGTHIARSFEKESNEAIREKIKKASSEALIPILCIGETLEEFQQERSAEVLTRQIGEATQGLTAAELSGLQIIYEAPWMKAAFARPTNEEIDHAYHFCRDLVHSLFGEPLASRIKVYCPVPPDLKEADAFVHTLHADGFYFCDPHQLAAIDEASLRAKAAGARKAKEVVVTADAAVAEAEAPKEEEAVEEVEEVPEPEEEVEEEVPEEEEPIEEEEFEIEEEEKET